MILDSFLDPDIFLKSDRYPFSHHHFTIALIINILYNYVQFNLKINFMQTRLFLFGSHIESPFTSGKQRKSPVYTF